MSFENTKNEFLLIVMVSLSTTW